MLSASSASPDEEPALAPKVGDCVSVYFSGGDSSGPMEIVSVDEGTVTFEAGLHSQWCSVPKLQRATNTEVKWIVFEADLSQ